MKKILNIILLMGLATACESYMDYPDIRGDGKYYLECFPSSGPDSTSLVLYRTHPLNRDARDYALAPVSAHLLVNDTPVAWQSTRKDGNGLLFSAATDLAEGDQVRLVVREAGDDVVIAESCIPSPPRFTYRRVLTSNWNDRYHVLLDSEENAGRNYYGVRLEGLFRYTTRFPDGSVEVRDAPMRDLRYGVNGSNDSLDLSGKVEGRFQSVSVAGQKMIVFEVDGSGDSPYELLVDTPNIEDRIEWLYMDLPSHRRALYRLHLYRMSPAAYRFFVPQENEILSGAGLVSPLTVQGNLKDAFGMVECVGGASTEWLPALTQEGD